MGGLQKSLISRSKYVNGHAVLNMKKRSAEFVLSVCDYLESLGVTVTPEYEIELLVRYGNYIAPVVVHGLDPHVRTPKFLERYKFNEANLPYDLASKLDIGLDDQIKLISPSHVNSLMGDIPRVVSVIVDEMFSTDVPEIDGHHLWVKRHLLLNLIRRDEYNSIRIHSSADFSELEKKVTAKFGKTFTLVTWEQKNKTLVWALGLESTIMVFLFIAMTMLVSLCITSGLLIFLGKIKGDLASFWILGASNKKLKWACAIFLNCLSFFSVIAGILIGLLFLYLLDTYGVEIMPEVFVDRRIPIYITAKGIIVSFFVPYLISIIFSLFSFFQYQRDTNYLEFVRTVG